MAIKRQHFFIMSTIKITIKEGTKAAQVFDNYLKQKAAIREAVKTGQSIPFAKGRLVKL